MESRFVISTVTQNGYPHYKIFDNKTGQTVYCDLNELNDTLYKMMEE